MKSRTRTISHYKAYSTGNTSSISEASFQYDILRAATMNGWRIDLSHTIPQDSTFADQFPPHHPKQPNIGRVRSYLQRLFPRQGLQRPFEWLLARKNNLFSTCYHTHDSRNSQKGFPDLVLIHPERPQIIFAELKDDKSYPTIEQRLFAAALLSVQHAYPDAVRYYLWRPKHYSQAIDALGGIDPLKYF